LSQTELFLKLTITHIVSSHINQRKELLQQELIEFANDPILLKRRYRMISQLADYESQIYKKIYQFRSNDINDYKLAAEQLIHEIYMVSNKNG